jgi:hypothetical protein
MKKRIWLGFLAVLAIAVSAGTGWYWKQLQSPVRGLPVSGESRSLHHLWETQLPLLSDKAVAEGYAPAISPAIAQVSAPAISPERLLAHVRALDFERYREDDRLRVREYISQQLLSWGWTPQLQAFDGGVNVWAQRGGTDPNAGAILVGAHYDTVPGSPGADDNASGVAAVLEVARLLGSQRTPRGLWVAFFDEEELGLRGSLAFTAGNLSLKELRGAIVLDMVGYACHDAGCQQYPKGMPVKPPGDKGDFLAVVGDVEHRRLLEPFERFGGGRVKGVDLGMPAVFSLPVPLKGVLVPDVLRSDHAAFWYNNIGAVLVTDTANLRTPHYHKGSDTPATIDRQFFAGAGQLVVSAASSLLEGRGSLASAGVSR